MKTVYKLFLATLFIGLASCNYLDIIPEERANDADAFKDPDAAKRYLYSCYSYLPNPRNGVESLDFMTGDEVVTAFEHETFAHFPKGGYTAANPRISYWNTLFQGIRQCYILINNVDNVARLEPKTAADYKAQAKFLIGYYHFLLIRCYGPTIVVAEEPRIDTNPKDYLGRSSLDECVDFVVKCFDEASAEFDALNSKEVVNRPADQFGLATSLVAKSIKARLLLYVASPLFNGTATTPPIFGSNGYNPENEIAGLVPATYDVNRWKRAKLAAKEAVELAQSLGHRLYYNNGRLPSLKYPIDPVQRNLRFALCDSEGLVENNELIWGDARGEGAYGIQKKSIPYWNNGSWNGVAPTEAMLKRFFTKNGLPYEWDNTFPIDYEELYKVSKFTADEISSGKPTNVNGTILMAKDREPRFYAWVGFQGGYYEVKNASDNTITATNPYFTDYTYNDQGVVEAGCGRVVTSFLANAPCGRGTGAALRTTNYSLTGFLNKKGVHPGTTATSGASNPEFYHWPLVRLADLYLMYAEACAESNESGDLATAQQYVDSVRLRAGLPLLDVAYNSNNLRVVPKGYHNTPEGMREIVRRERMVEMYLENQNFWDMRRWLLAGDKVNGTWGDESNGYFNRKHYGCDIDGVTLSNFCKRKETPVLRGFIAPTNYLLPIPSGEINKNLKLVQNPGY